MHMSAYGCLADYICQLAIMLVKLYQALHEQRRARVQYEANTIKLYFPF